MQNLSIPHVMFKRDHPEARLPYYASEGAAGADVFSVDAAELSPQGGRALIRTGLLCLIPAGWEIQVRPRSGLAFKHGVTVLNAPGTIDSDYRGELGILLINHGLQPFQVNMGDRIAQIVVARVQQAKFTWSDEDLPETVRGAGGFGSTGL